MGEEAQVAPVLAGDADECTLAGIEAYSGVVADRTGDYAAGRTIIHEDSEDFLSLLASRPCEPG